MRRLPRSAVEPAQFHIASLVVHCRPERLAEVAANVEALDVASVPERDARGKLVVLLETASEQRLVDTVSEIERLPGVIGAGLVFHQIDQGG